MTEATGRSSRSSRDGWLIWHKRLSLGFLQRFKWVIGHLQNLCANAGVIYHIFYFFMLHLKCWNNVFINKNELLLVLSSPLSCHWFVILLCAPLSFTLSYHLSYIVSLNLAFLSRLFFCFWLWVTVIYCYLLVHWPTVRMVILKIFALAFFPHITIIVIFAIHHLHISTIWHML